MQVFAIAYFYTKIIYIKCMKCLENQVKNRSAEGKNEIAKNLIKLGLNIDDIVKATGLSKEEIEKISKEK